MYFTASEGVLGAVTFVGYVLRINRAEYSAMWSTRYVSHVCGRYPDNNLMSRYSVVIIGLRKGVLCKFGAIRRSFTCPGRAHGIRNRPERS